MMKLLSEAFAYGEEIPLKYGCKGENISMPLQFEEVPQECASLAIIMEDPDAPTGLFVHWVIYNIPYNIEAFPQNVPPAAMLNKTIIQGFNDFDRIGYGGPCPPDKAHRYFIKLYALDIKLDDAPPGYNREQLLEVMDGHIIAEAELMGTYAP